ncbi:uncharacterized protein LOC133796305 [Humulus lupulus]|uniref:uncharacterized protein LOC133796305 n=1 Tax=Humulus lupulus TaxID=3486 RepID=UPI002B416476|nr:uncharacterized protein LOC133796305 [Humulus lupulus]
MHSPVASPQHSVSTEQETKPSAQDYESTLSLDVLATKLNGKCKSIKVSPKQTKKTKVTKAKGTSSIFYSTPLYKFKKKAKINPLACTSSKDVSPDNKESLPDPEPSQSESIQEEPQEDAPLEEFEEETEFKEDPSEVTTVASDPKGK